MGIAWAQGDLLTDEEIAWVQGDPLIEEEKVWAPGDHQREEVIAWAPGDHQREEVIAWAPEDLLEDKEIAWALGDPPKGEAPPKAPCPRGGDPGRIRGAAAGTWTIGPGGGRRGGEGATGH